MLKYEVLSKELCERIERERKERSYARMGTANDSVIRRKHVEKDLRVSFRCDNHERFGGGSCYSPVKHS